MKKKIDFFSILDEKGFKLAVYDAFLSGLLASMLMSNRLLC